METFYIADVYWHKNFGNQFDITPKFEPAPADPTIPLRILLD